MLVVVSIGNASIFLRTSRYKCYKMFTYRRHMQRLREQIGVSDGWTYIGTRADEEGIMEEQADTVSSLYLRKAERKERGA